MGYSRTVQAQQEFAERPGISPAPSVFSDARTLRIDGPLTAASLSHIRHAIADHAPRWHLHELVVETVQTVSSELAGNIIAHAGGDGRLVLTRLPGGVYCQAIDRGPGIPLPFLAGWQAPAIGEPEAPRGLWTVRTLSARMQIDSSVMGTTVTAVIIWR